MNVIITDTFKKDFCKIFSEKVLKNFSEKLKSTSIINLDYPYKKYKITLENIATRWIYIISINKFFVPIFIVKKSDKKYGSNLIITKEISLILKLKYEKNIENIRNDQFQIF